MDERSPRQYANDLAKQLGLCTKCHQPLSRNDAAGTQVSPERFNLLQAELADAHEQIAVLADFPQNLQWLTPFERMAYAAGIIQDADILPCNDCNHEGNVANRLKENDYPTTCEHCLGNGSVLSDIAMTRIKEAYPQYGASTKTLTEEKVIPDKVCPPDCNMDVFGPCNPQNCIYKLPRGQLQSGPRTSG